ncbi:MAG: ComEA family DNA-binding protein [Candidatus Saganbacteria bacterium]|nr:ComEA family DNA-binding protein [Candidatus Saganbacteria bacterium]
MLKDITKEQLYIILGLIASIIIGSGVLVYNRYFAPADEKVLVDEPREEVLQNETIIVHVSGEVKREGVYKMKIGDRVVDAIALARGATDRADLSQINLAKTLSDGEKLVILKKREQAKVEGKINSSNEQKSPEGGLVDINSADEKTLCSLPSIGPSTAKKIIEYRQSKGSFASIEELTQIPRLGKKTLEKIKDKITIY